MGETLHVVIRQIGHRHALSGIILGSAVHSAKLNFINLLPSAFRQIKEARKKPQGIFHVAADIFSAEPIAVLWQSGSPGKPGGPPRGTEAPLPGAMVRLD